MMTLPEPTGQSAQSSAPIVLLGGLPGSGKTSYARTLAEHGWRLFDDFQKRAYNDSAAFRDSRHFPELLEAIRKGTRCIVADIRVVHAEYRADAQRTLRRELGDVAIEVCLFANDPAQCAQNIRNAPERRMEKRLEGIVFWSKHYSCPPGARVIPVWRPSQ